MTAEPACGATNFRVYLLTFTVVSQRIILVEVEREIKTCLEEHKKTPIFIELIEN